MDFFNDILVIVNFNFPHYENIPFIKEIYSFPNIVFYGDDIPGSFCSEVTLCKQHKGFFSYRVMLDAQKKYPNYQGYLFLMDDLLLNYWNLTKFDKNKVWFIKFQSKHNVVDVINSDRKDWWWGRQFGKERCASAWQELSDRFKNRLEKTLGVRNAFVGGNSDIYYVPKRLVEDYVEIFNIMSNNEVFLELAIPTGLYAIEDYDNFETMLIKYLWSKYAGTMSMTGDRLSWRSFYSKELTGLHPVKFKDKNNQNTIRWLFANRHTKSVLKKYWSIQGIRELLLMMWYHLIVWWNRDRVRKTCYYSLLNFTRPLRRIFVFL